MTVKDLEALYDYGYWANRKLFDVSLRSDHAGGLTDVDQDFGPSYADGTAGSCEADSVVEDMWFLSPSGNP